MKRIHVLAILLLAVATVASSECLLTFQTESLPDFFLGEPTNFRIEAVSGNEPYTFTLVDGAMPAGLHFHSSGKITGVPREETDTTIFVNVTDADGCSTTRAFALRVTPAP